jgi:hypothetical protein
MPVVQASIDNAVADQIEATFARDRWFDALYGSSEEMREIADRLLFDLREIEGPVEETYYLGAIYGTGIAKIAFTIPDPGQAPRWGLIPIDPFEFIIDPGARSIEQAEGMAHKVWVPYGLVIERQDRGIYAKGNITPRIDTVDMHRHVGEMNPQQSELVKITEWHGLVPTTLMPRGEKATMGDVAKVGEFTEAIVTIANDDMVLDAKKNVLGRDRAFVAYQHERVPRRFYGRGIAEKAKWPQRVLDAEIRSRIDALAFSSAPMMAINATNAPRGERFGVYPGRTVLVNGNVSDSIQPLQFGGPDPRTFEQTSHMERMAESATGQLLSPAKDISTHNALGS